MEKVMLAIGKFKEVKVISKSLWVLCNQKKAWQREVKLLMLRNCSRNFTG